MALSSMINGFVVGSGLIIAIGPQNTFVISQGIKREHVFLSAAICTMTDTLLILLGVVGLGMVFNLHPMFTMLARWFGVIFLTFYAVLKFRSVVRPPLLGDEKLDKKTYSMNSIIVTLLCLGLLNPHAYLDTVVLIGSIAAQQAGTTKYLFGIGAIFASVCWFFGIAYGAKLLTPIFKNANAWRILDTLIGAMMLIIAFTIMMPVISS